MPPKSKKAWTGILTNPLEFAYPPVAKGAQQTQRIPIWIDSSSHTELLQCPKCEEFIMIATRTSFQHWLGHQGSQTCEKAQRKLERQRSTAGANAALRINTVEISSSLTSVLGTSSKIVLPPSSPPAPSSPPIASPERSPTPQLPSPTVPLDSESIQYTPFIVISPTEPSDTEAQVPRVEIDKSYHAEASNPCRGLPVRWTAGSVWSSYAFWQHESPDYSWYPIGFSGDHTIVLWSKHCCNQLQTLDEIAYSRCKRCAALEKSSTLESNLERAQNAKPSTPHKYLSPIQMSELLRKSRDVSLRQRGQIRSLRRQVMRLKTKVSNDNRIFMKLASHDVPGASRILDVSLRRGDSSDVIMRKLEGAISGAFRPKGKWSEREFDIAYLVKALGGPRLSFVLQNAKHSPSVATLKRNKPTPTVIVSIDTPTDEEISANIEIMLGSRPPPSNIAVGQNLMIDGIATEQVPRYDEKNNTVVGLCKEHSTGQKKTIDGLADIEALRKGLQDDNWHYAKEGIVFTLAPMSDLDNYWPSPVLIVPSCGTGKGPDMAKLIARWIKIYNGHRSGRARHGEIVNVSTDGESSFRGARYELGLKAPASRGSDVLRGLSGLNTHVGDNDLLGCCDPKHIFKRFAQNLRSATLQITLGDTAIGHHDIPAALRHSEVTEERINMLLNPQDKQNVPIALDLIKELRNTTVPNSPASKRIQHVKLLAELYSFFIVPFTDTTLSLAAQIRMLSTYAHLTFALYCKHRQDFMKGALYGDSMSIVKSIIILVARWQVEDGEIIFYIILIGTDRIEGVFSHVRTQDHARNCDILQLGNKSSIGAEINRILLRWPDLHRGHEKRDIKDSKGEDHINPASWDITADLTVGSVVLGAEFFGGRTDATKWLWDNLQIEIDWDAEYGPDFKNDFLKPFGDYVGSNAADEADGEEQGVESAAVPVDLGITPEATELEASEEEILGMESESAPAASTEPESGENTTQSNRKYLFKDGKRYHKSSVVVKMLISPSSRKVVIRQFRAAGMTIHDLMLPTTKEHIFNGDLGSFLCQGVGSERSVALAVLEVSHFRQGAPGSGKILFQIERTELEKSNIFVVGQILELAWDAQYLEGSWIWTKKYKKLTDSSSTGKGSTGLTVTIPGTRFSLLQPLIRTGDDAAKHTWVLTPSQLERAKKDLWLLLEPESDEVLSTIDSIPKFTSSDLPYRQNGKIALAVEDASCLLVTKHDGEATVPCYLCGLILKLKNMRNHVGGHILKAARDIVDPVLRSDINPSEMAESSPCGWCGRYTTPCRTQFKDLGKDKYAVLSNCEYHYTQMKYAPASKFSKATPCTNVPIACLLCSTAESELGSPTQHITTVWKYNLQTHLATHHLQEDGAYPLLPPRMLLAAYTSKAEEHAMGILEEKTLDARGLLGLPLESEGMIMIEEDLKRGRSDSASKATSAPKRKRKT
ncbi:hypothetical protein DFP72DRAFT_1059553 [Ephemerocybe angulata]|uniref:Uncharacterized protein n=1 Tax=Ephemerocybe angulata TaxID=980116 RepID=A0A8H6MDK2_9AGAR|nr:hypothetical protein DFP72DRAFT_1059553 [Tulosesus angulatus]